MDRVQRNSTPTKKSPGSALDYALEYAVQEGVPVIWIPARTKGPTTLGWPSLATTDAATIKGWDASPPGCNFGLVMGNGFGAIDVDDPSKLPELKRLGFELPPTRLHQTSRGFHLLYRVPKGIANLNAPKLLGIEGIEFRHYHLAVVCPGSVHPSGFVYRIGENIPIASLPPESLAMLLEWKPSTKPASSSGKKIAEGGRNDTLFRRACLLRAHGDSQETIEAKLLELNRQECDPPLPENEIATIARSAATYSPSEQIRSLKDGTRPLVMLPSDDRLMSDCAAELGEHLADELYLFNGEVVALDGSTPRPVTPQLFRTLIENFAVCARQRVARKVTVEVWVTMTVEEARGILAADHFRNKLRPLKRIATCRVPVLRSNGQMELLPDGYDPETATVTISDVVYAEDVAFEDGVATVRDLFNEFEFADGERSLAVAVTALVGLFAAQLVDARSLRPIYTVTKNSPGAGATILAACVTVPVLGHMPAGIASEDDAEMRKTLTAALREGRTVLVLDNVKGRVNLPALEAFTTTHIWRDRLLGSNETFEGANNVTTIITANGVTITEDLRRRMLFVELHLSAERPENRVFKRDLDVAVLVAMRPRILAACWALVRHWDAQGRPQPSRTHSFPSWDRIVGGIVEAAGFACPFAPSAAAAVADEDGDSMRVLVAAMNPGTLYTSKEMAALCRVEGAFLGLVGTCELDMQHTHFSAFGKVLGRWNNRLVADGKFAIIGSGHGRRFSITAPGVNQHGRTVEHGVSPECLKNEISTLESKTVLDRATVQTRFGSKPAARKPKKEKRVKKTAPESAVVQPAPLVHVKAPLPKFTKLGHIAWQKRTAA